MTNNEKFNQLINACEDPERMLSALLLIVPAIREAKTQQEREALLADLKGDAEA